MNREQIVIKECKRIADDIVDRASEKDDNLSWYTLHTIGTKIVRGQSQTLYGGVAGIILFLLEMHRVFGSKKYRDAIVPEN